MTNVTNTVPAKIAALAAGLGLVAMSFVALVPGAHAQTTTTSTSSTANLQAQIAALQAQILALQAQLSASGTTGVGSFTTDLTLGAQGTQVTALQTWLISKGFSIPAGATGYFGTQTRAAVASFQAAQGITPAAGYFGPITRTRVNAMLTTTVPTTPSTDTSVLTGNGRLTDISSLGDVDSDIKEGDSVTKVVGASVDATNGDVRLQRVDAEFEVAAGNNSSNLDRYVDSVSLYVNDTRVATLDASDGEKDGRKWSYRFANLSNVIKNGATANIYVAVTPVSNVDDNESGKSITTRIPVDGIRAAGADNISEVYVGSAITQSFTVSDATTGTLTISASSNNPRDSRVEVNANNTTTGVTLLAFNLRAKNQDVTLDELPVSLSTSDNNLNDVVSTLRLMKGSTVLRSKTVSTGSNGVVVFDNLNQTISADNTDQYSIVADLKSTNAYTNGTTLIASTTYSLTGFDVSDENGDTVTPSGSATGPTVTLSTTGINVARTNTSVQKTNGLAGSGDSTQYTISFSVTAGDDDIYIDRSIQQSSNPSAAGAGIAWATTSTSASGVTGSGIASFGASDSNSGDTATSFKVNAGTTRTFTFNVALIATGPGYTGVRLTGINFDTDPNTDDSTDYYISGLDTFRTDDVYMQMR